jgi:C_GCAxxG_C_C family probable redox protein
MNTYDDPAEKTGAAAQRARDTLLQCGNCAQASFAALQDAFDLEGEQVLKALTPFPGIALRGETCGAVVGSLMAIGLVFGRERLDDWPGFIVSLRPARRFCLEFEKTQGSTICADLLEARMGRSYNLAHPGEALIYANAGGSQVCSEIVMSAVEIAVEIIQQK